jgi:hypothetical protein
MKRFVVAAAVIAMAVSPFAAFAQEAKPADTSSSTIKNPSDMYPFRLDVVKVYQHSLGYMVVYRVGTDQFAQAYIPIGWFKSGGKAQLIRANDPSHPYMVIYYRQGKFDHVRLFVKDNVKDPSWGILEGGADLADKFKVEEIVPKY